MGLDFIKEADKNLVEMINRVSIDKPLSEDLPENIKEIDRVVGEASLEGKINLSDPEADFSKKLEAVLRSKGVMPDWDIKDLAPKIIARFTLRQHSWDHGFGKMRAEHLAVYERLKDRPCVKRIVELTGLNYIPYEAQLTIVQIQLVDSMRAEGMDYAEIASEFSPDSNCDQLAFLNHVEETYKTTVKTVKQFQKLTKCTDETASVALYSAFEGRYGLTLDRILREEGKYAQLIALDPKDFHLPKVWHGVERNMTKTRVVRRAITHYFQLAEPGHEMGRYALRDVANLIEAPYVEILKASHYYSDLKDEPEAKE
jgi:hypothetical protein